MLMIDCKLLRGYESECESEREVCVCVFVCVLHTLE